MARWWKLVISGGRADDLNDKDFEHIADLVKQGYTEGDLSSDEPGYETACAFCGQFLRSDEAAKTVHAKDGDTLLYCSDECATEGEAERKGGALAD